MRAGEVNLKDSYAVIRGGQLVLVSAYIKNYDKGSFSNVDSRRDRRLLMHRQEIMRLLGKVKEKGFSLVPLNLIEYISVVQTSRKRYCGSVGRAADS